MKLHRYLLTSIFIASAAIATARTLSPSDVASQILEASPSTCADMLKVSALSESFKTEGNLPDPEIEGEYLFAQGDEKNRWGAGVSWGLEWPGVYSARKAGAKGKLSAAETAAALAKRERLIEIKSLLLDYVLAEKQLQVLEEIQLTNDSIMALSEKAQLHGELTRLDINKLRLEQATVRSGILSLQDSREEAVAALNVIYGNDCRVLLRDMECEFPEISMPTDLDVSMSPAVAAAKAEAEAAKGELKVASAEAYPGLSIGYQHAFEDGAHFNGASVGISIPLFSSRGKKSAAKAAIAEAEYNAEKAKEEAVMEIDGIRRRLEILKRQIDEMSPVICNPENSELLMKAYRGGVITLIDYLNERAYFTNATLELLTLRHAAAGLLVRMEIMAVRSANR